MGVSRRTVIKGAASVFAAGAVGLPALAKGRSFNIAASAAIANMCTVGAGGNVAADWGKQNGADVEWLRLDLPSLSERLFRELTLNQGGIDMSFIYIPWGSPNILNLLEPLNSYMEKDPIEDFSDFLPEPLKMFSLDGLLHGLPIRMNIDGLHYNEVLFEERGLSGPPTTMEELLDYARKLTYTRADGTPVAGLVFPRIVTNYIDFVRAWNADFIDEQYKIRANEPPMVAAISALADLYKDGALPKQFLALGEYDSVTWLQTGRAAMTVTPMARYAAHNDPKKSLFPGRIKVAAAPIISKLKDQFALSPVGYDVWSLVVPKNAQNKELSWSFIKALASKEGTRRLVQNGNGPTRASAYGDPDYKSYAPYADAQREVLKYARVELPPLEKSALVMDTIVEECDAAVGGLKSPQEAMDSLAARLKPLVPA